MASPSPDLMRIDPLTGCKNFLGFLEACIDPSAEAAAGPVVEGPTEDPHPRRKNRPDFVMNAQQFSGILFVSMHNMRLLNETKGYAYGDSVIRWMAILLQEETGQAVYRLTGTEFAVFLNMQNDQEHILLLERMLERMDREAKSLEFPGEAADVVLILNDQPANHLDSLLMQMGEAMVQVKNSDALHHRIFHASDLKIPAWSPHTWMPASRSDISYAVRWITRAGIVRVMEMGKIFDIAQQDAYTDLTSNLPNIKVALANIEKCLRNAREKGRPFSIRFIDGDNLREFNHRINYAAGDEVIREVSAILKQHVRPTDFVARWRAGDEFIVTLPDTTLEDAKKIGERFRQAVKHAARNWRIPFTISIGISSYPASGEDLDTLVDKVEMANKQAKQQGKDQVVVAD